MNFGNFGWLLLITAGFSWLLTGALRRHALTHQRLMDRPNQRSAHQQPTPRGGGTAIALSFLGMVLYLGWQNALPADLTFALLGAGSGIAVLGFMDDHGHIAARWRLLGHFASAGWILFCLGGFPPLPELSSQPHWLMQILAVIGLVWLLNLYNFMDGLDGLASMEAISVCLGGALLCGLSEQDHSFLLISELLLAAAVAGFLIWNAPPARIFMGDAGSGFLGITLGALLIQATWINPKLFWGGLILLGVFMVDTTLTLIRRLVRGERIYEAHRRHAYQYAARQYHSHRAITLGVTLINGGWLLPMALWVVMGGLPAWVGLGLAYLPLIVLALHFRAGLPEPVSLDPPN